MDLDEDEDAMEQREDVEVEVNMLVDCWADDALQKDPGRSAQNVLFILIQVKDRNTPR